MSASFNVNFPIEDDPVCPLLIRWVQSFEEGSEISPEDLCLGAKEHLESLIFWVRKLRPILKLQQRQPLIEPRAFIEYQRVRYVRPGGVGEVWRVCNQQMQWEVALKCLLPSLARDVNALARFQREASIAGSLVHRGIPPTHLYGIDPHGRPFYLMRFVEGPTLADAVGQKPLRDLIRSLADVCVTVAYAHSRGTVHRDIKPSNIILGAFGETFLIDWGSACRIEELREPEATSSAPQAAPPSFRLTQSGAIPGTFAYMSPEQAEDDRARLGPPCDVFALGATLYLILTEHAPYEQLDAEARRLAAIKCQPCSPRQLNPDVDRELETICLRAMQPNPHDRCTPEELQGLLQTWLDRRLVPGHPYSLRSRVWFWLREHPRKASALLTFLFTFALTAALGGLVLWFQYEATAAEKTRADENLEVALEALDHIQDNEDLVKSPLKRFRRDLLRLLVLRYQRLSQRNAGDSRSRARQGDAQLRLALVSLELGDTDTALDASRKASVTFRDLHAREPASKSHRRQQAVALGLLGRVLAQENFAAAETALREAIRFWQEVDPADPEREAQAVSNLGALHLQAAEQATIRNDPEALKAHLRNAEPPLRESLRKREKLVRDARSELHLRALSDSLNNLSEWTRLSGDAANAVLGLERTIAIRRELVRDHPKDATHQAALADSLCNLGNWQTEQKIYPQADQSFREGCALRERLQQRFPDEPEHRQGAVEFRFNLSDLLLRQGKHDAAEKELTNGLKLCDELIKDFPDSTPFNQLREHGERLRKQLQNDRRPGR